MAQAFLGVASAVHGAILKGDAAVALKAHELNCASRDVIGRELFVLEIEVPAGTIKLLGNKRRTVRSWSR